MLGAIGEECCVFVNWNRYRDSGKCAKIKTKEEIKTSLILAIVLYLNWAKFGEHVKFFFAQIHVLKLVLTSETTGRENQLFLAFFILTHLNV